MIVMLTDNFCGRDTKKNAQHSVSILCLEIDIDRLSNYFTEKYSDYHL